MKYDISDIRDRELRVSLQLDHGVVHGLLLPVGVEPADGSARVEVDLTLSPVGTTGMRGGVAITVRGRISGCFSVPCARCLAPAVVEVTDPDVYLTFLPPSTRDPAREVELAAEDLNTHVHDGLHIDLEPVVREQLVLAIPIMPLCREDCRGICSRCGVDRNQEPCSCDASAQPSMPWVDALAKISS